MQKGGNTDLILISSKRRNGSRPTAEMGGLFSIFGPSFRLLNKRDTAARTPAHETLSMASLAVQQKRRLLIVDDDRDSTHLVKILLEKTGRYLVLEQNDATKAH